MNIDKKILIRIRGKDGLFKYEVNPKDKFFKLKEFLSINLGIDPLQISLSKNQNFKENLLLDENIIEEGNIK
jgi:hypothetical protein